MTRELVGGCSCVLGRLPGEVTHHAVAGVFEGLSRGAPARDSRQAGARQALRRRGAAASTAAVAGRRRGRCRDAGDGRCSSGVRSEQGRGPRHAAQDRPLARAQVSASHGCDPAPRPEGAPAARRTRPGGRISTIYSTSAASTAPAETFQRARGSSNLSGFGCVDDGEIVRALSGGAPRAPRSDAGPAPRGSSRPPAATAGAGTRRRRASRS